MPAPTMPCSGMNQKLRPMFNAAAKVQMIGVIRVLRLTVTPMLTIR